MEEEATKLHEKIDSLEKKVVSIRLGDLIEEKLIDPVKDPKNGGFISEETLIKIEYRNNQFVTEINK